MANLDASPGVLNLTLAQGKTWDLLLTLRDSDAALVDLSGYSCSWQVRETPSASTAVVSASVGGTAGAITMGGTAGTIRLVVPSTVTAGVAAGPYAHEFELVDGSGARPPFVGGAVTVTAEVVK